ncbi:Cytokinesis protein sepH [Neofusicoccum parvum]|uniref:Cytokinesis protein sepH n=1 Tax=Neofusicoccum parvum TaxID=310453 RepID=A0ACB5SNL1_9PEZI|nr:Cytokinesis protein sepH [Neofusicoccum parvum]
MVAHMSAHHVYRALNWGTGETVAIKQVKLADLPKNELRVIMLEIDLLKNLNHPNIVKYHGFVKDAQSLYIILEYCENGSLHSICKNFGKFPENLVAIYMSQVLHGLLYLHEQGVIHRDIKGANILTTKEGLVKLADFGVATKTAGLNDSSVVAPVPPQGGLRVKKTRSATEVFASQEEEENDNWDDDFASSINASALQLPHLRPHDNFAGLLSSEKLKAYATSFDTVTEEPSAENIFDGSITLSSPPPLDYPEGLETIRPLSASKKRPDSGKSSRTNSGAQKGSQEPKTQFFRGMSKAAVVPPINPRISSFTKPTAAFRENSVEDYSDLIASDDAAFQKKLQFLKDRNNKEYTPRLFHPSDLTNVPRSAQNGKKSGSLRLNVSGGSSDVKDSVKQPNLQVGIEKYAEHEEEDFSDVFGNDGAAPSLRPKHESDSGSERGTLRMMNSKLSGSWLGDEEDEEDPFAQLEEGFDEMDQETNVARDRYARLISLVENRVSSLKSTQPEEVLYDVSDELLQILMESPEIKNVIISSHGMLPILEILESLPRREIILDLLKIVNIIILDNVEIQENLCFVGGIPIITQFAHKKFPSEIRQEAAAFVRQMYQTSTLTLQMFIGCGGLNVLVEFLEEDLEDDRDFVLIGVNGVWSVFNLQITMLKFIKNLSMLTTTHEALQNSNAIEVLTDLLSSSMKLPHFREVSNQILNILYNLCRLSKPRQEDAALNGVIPLLQTIVKTEWPLKEFALPILCDMAHSGKVGRKVLWQNKGLQFYISLLSDKYWQVTALDAIFIWLQEETARVEQALISGSFPSAIISCFTTQDSSVDAFENLLEPLQKLLRLSPPVAALLAHPELFSRVGQKLHTRKPVVRLNLLRIIRSICDATEESGGGAPLIQAHGLLDAIKRLAESDPAILIPALERQEAERDVHPTWIPTTRSAAAERHVIQFAATHTTNVCSRIPAQGQFLGGLR